MSEYVSRGRGHDVSYASPAVSHDPVRPQRTPAELAADRITRFARDVDAVGTAVESVRKAHAANDPTRWQEAKESLERVLTTATATMASARGAASETAADAQQELATAETSLAEHRAAMTTLTEAPRGWKAVSREAEMMKILAAAGPDELTVSWSHKVAALKTEIDQLSAVDCLTLTTRLKKRSASDPIASALAPGVRVNQHRYDDLLEHLAGARREKATAQQAARTTAAGAAPPVQTTVHEQAIEPAAVVATAVQTTTAVGIAEPEPETVDTRLRRLLESGSDHIEKELGELFATLDASARRALARRLETYRPGNGDDVAARFARLDRSERTRLLAVLDGAARVASALAPATTSAGPEVGDSNLLRDAAPVAGGSGAKAQTAHAEGSQGGKRDPAAVTSNVTATPTREPAAPRTTADVIKQMADAGKPDVAWAYLRANENQFVAVFGKRLGTVHPQLHERLAWRTNGLATRFHDALYQSLAGDKMFIRLPELLHPADPWYVIDQHRVLSEGTPGVIVDGREPTGPLFWNPLAGDALAIDLVTRMQESLVRMVPRYAAQLDAKHPAHVTVEDLVTSHPIDRVTAHLLCDEQVVRPIAAKQKSTKKSGPADPSLFPEGVRFLEDYRWLGSTDPFLWNYIEVRAPRDATPEDVAATLWLDPAASYRAYGITGASPYFRVEATWARMFADAKHYAPDGVDAPHKDNALALAGSALATDAAIAQAADERAFDKRGIPVPADRKHLQIVLDQGVRQLDRIKAQLAPWKLWELVTPAASWLAAHRQHLTSIPDHRLIALAPVIDGQQEILFEAAGAISDVARAAGSTAGVEDDEGVVTSVLRRYAIAVGESHLIDTARPELARARAAKGQLSIALLERSVQDTQGAVNELRGNETLLNFGGENADATLGSARRKIVDLRGRQASGQTVDPGEVDVMSAELKESAVDARTKSWYLQLHNLREEARDSQNGFFETLASGFSADVRALPKILTGLITVLQEQVMAPHAERKKQKLREAGDAPDPGARAAILREAAHMTEENLAAFVRDNYIAQAFGPWIAMVENQHARTAVIQVATHIALLIGTGIAGSFAGTAVSSAIRGALLADAADATVGMLWGSRIATTAGAVGGLTTDAAINATMQTATGGGSFGDAFLDNFIASGAVRVALAPLYKVAEAYGGAQKELKNLSLWERSLKRGKTVLRGGAILTAEMVTGAAVDYVWQRARHGKPPDEKTAMEWALNGGSMAIGGFVGKWLKGYESRLAGLMEHGAHLRVRAIKMKALAKRVEEHGSSDGAMELLAERHLALEEEASAIHDLYAKGKLSVQTASTLEMGNRSEMNEVKDASFATMPLRLAGLRPDDASGKVWVGTTEEIAIALHQGHRAGLSVAVLDHDQAARQWKILYNGEELTILENGLAGQPRAAKANVTGADRRHATRYAESAEFLQERWEAKTKSEIDHRDVIEFDHMQAGYAFAGIVNQATLPASGEGLGAKVVVYDHKGTLSGRGAQELGQPPDKFDAPGVRATEQAPHGTEWIKSEHLDRALDIGRLETQSPAYQGRAVELQARPRGPADPTSPDPWKAPNRALRVKIRDAAGGERWFYCDHFDNVGGLGPASLKDAAKVIDPHQMSAMLAGNQPQVLRGDDPDYAKKVRSGRVLVWGGTPTGAWAAEPVVHAPETQVTVLGDTRERPDWASLLREYEDINYEIASHPGDQVPADMAARKAKIEQLIAKAHSGMTIPRNTKPGATYDKPVTNRGPHDVQIEFGTPSKIAPTEDGRVLVTVGTGETAHATVYDQVVIAHGPDPGQPGAPGGLLGPGASSGGDVPAGTIALRPLYGPKRADGQEPEILALESIDPPGIVLKGAAYASKRMSPFVF